MPITGSRRSREIRRSNTFPNNIELHLKWKDLVTRKKTLLQLYHTGNLLNYFLPIEKYDTQIIIIIDILST